MEMPNAQITHTPLQTEVVLYGKQLHILLEPHFGIIFVCLACFPLLFMILEPPDSQALGALSIQLTLILFGVSLKFLPGVILGRKLARAARTRDADKLHTLYCCWIFLDIVDVVLVIVIVVLIGAMVHLLDRSRWIIDIFSNSVGYFQIQNRFQAH